MISIDGEFDFTHIRKYHPEIEFIARARENRNEPINSIKQTIFIDLNSVEELEQFHEEFTILLLKYGIVEEHALNLLFLTQKAYSDIDNGRIASQNLNEMIESLTFLRDLLKMEELAKIETNPADQLSYTPYCELEISVQHYNRKSKAKLHTSMIPGFINYIIKSFKDKGNNYDLAAALEKVDLTSVNISRILKSTKKKSTNIAEYYTETTAYILNDYLNDHISRKRKAQYSHENLRFIYDLLELFKLLPNLNLNIPPVPEKIDVYKMGKIKDVIKNMSKFDV